MSVRTLMSVTHLRLLLRVMVVTHGVVHYSSGLVGESESGSLAEAYVTLDERIFHYTKQSHSLVFKP